MGSHPEVGVRDDWHQSGYVVLREGGACREVKLSLHQLHSGLLAKLSQNGHLLHGQLPAHIVDTGAAEAIYSRG